MGEGSQKSKGARHDKDKLTVLEVKDLSVAFHTQAGLFHAVKSIGFDLERRKVLAIVGESGCGKSVTVRSIMGLLEKPGEITAGQVFLEGEDFMTLSENEKRQIRGSKVGMVFQDHEASFDPLYTIGFQFEELLKAHLTVSSAEARHQVIDLLAKVKLQDPERVYHAYPFELSGGMRQRAMIAMAMALQPVLLIADEPTTSLDVTVQAGIIREFRKLKKNEGCAMIVVTHDLGVVAELADNVLVMYAGSAVEKGSVYDIFYRPAHPYTAALLRSLNSRAIDKCLFSIPGQPPDMANLPPGCVFSPRCPVVKECCSIEEPRLVRTGMSREVCCWSPLDQQRKVVEVA